MSGDKQGLHPAARTRHHHLSRSSGPLPAVSVTSWYQQARWNRCTSRSDTGPGYRSEPEGTGRTGARRTTTQDTRGHADGEHARSSWLDLRKATRKWRSWCRTFSRRMAVSTFSVCHRQRGPESTCERLRKVFTLNSPRAPVARPTGQQPACRRIPDQVERRGYGSPSSTPSCRLPPFGLVEPPWRDRVRSANRRRTGGSERLSANWHSRRHGRQRKCGPGAVAMVEDRQVTTEDVLEDRRRRRRLCDDVEVDDPVTADAVLTAFPKPESNNG